MSSYQYIKYKSKDELVKELNDEIDTLVYSEQYASKDDLNKISN